MKVLHVVPGLGEVGNGIAVAAKLIASEQGADLVEARLFASGKCDASQYEEIWVHSAWLPIVLRSCRRVLKSGKRLIRMAHANYDPVRLRFHGWKKWLVRPIERFYLCRAKTIVATCEAEKGWIEAYLGRWCPPVEVTDIKRFFDFGHKEQEMQEMGRPLHLLYLGRRHPLKGVEYLETALGKCGNVKLWKYGNMEIPNGEKEGIVFRAESEVCGEAKEKAWEWCDVLVLPTLSENFGLVVAEALERGKRVITTDGAPAWGEGLSRVEHVERVEGGEILAGYGGRLIYLKGYRDGSDEKRVELLKEAIEGLVHG